MNYWALDDPLFADGHYVEDWELQRFSQLAPDLQAFTRAEARRGNKIESIAFDTVSLSRPPTTGVLGLPDGLCFICPIQHTGTRVYYGAENGAILHLETDARLQPSGYEKAPEDWLPLGPPNNDA